MHDRVADVLAQRAALDGGTGTAIAISLLVHAGLCALAVYTAIHHAPPQVASMVTIHLAPMTAPPIAKPATKPKPQTIQEPKPQPVTPPKPEQKPAPKNTVPMSPFGKSTKKGSEAPPPTELHNSTTPQLPAQEGPVGVTAIEGDFPYTIYLERMKTLIGTHWLRAQGGTGAVVSFVIERDGTIRDVALDASSGNSTFDRNAQRAILESSPLPPLPFAYGGTDLRVHLTFK